MEQQEIAVKNLNEFSKNIMITILSEHPEWTKYMSVEKEILKDNFEIAYLVFEIPPPKESNTIENFLIYTMNDEITVSFDCYHSHFDYWSADTEDFENSAKYFVDNLLNEKISIISWWHGNKLRLSSQIEDVNNLVPSHKFDYNMIRIRSWYGKKNLDKYIA